MELSETAGTNPMWKGENIFSASQTACLNQGLLPEALVLPSASSEVLLSSRPCGSGTRGEETKAQGPEAQRRGLLVSCLVGWFSRVSQPG